MCHGGNNYLHYSTGTYRCYSLKSVGALTFLLRLTAGFFFRVALRCCLFSEAVARFSLSSLNQLNSALISSGSAPFRFLVIMCIASSIRTVKKPSSWVRCSSAICLCFLTQGNSWNISAWQIGSSGYQIPFFTVRT